MSFIDRLKSRKFLLAVSVVAAALAAKQYGAAVSALLAYFGINVVEKKVAPGQ